MAEGFLRAYAGDRFAVQSAGTKATELHPLAVRAMREVGIDISRQTSKSVDELGEGWDVVVTVCDANCPIPPRSGLKLRWSYPDPALAGGDEEERLAAFRTVRDALGKRARSLAARLG
jgi:arsenate reductase